MVLGPNRYFILRVYSFLCDIFYRYPLNVKIQPFSSALRKHDVTGQKIAEQYSSKREPQIFILDNDQINTHLLYFTIRLL